MTLKLSCLPVSLYPEFSAGRLSIAGWAEIAGQSGLDAIDLSVLMTRKLDSAALAAAAGELKRRGMPVDTVVTYTDFTNPDPACREQEFDRFKADIAAATVFGAAYLRLTAGQAHPGIGRRQGIEWTLAYFERAAEFARRKGVGLLFENHSKPGVWQYYDFAAPPDVYFDIAQSLAGAGIDLLFDTANACFYKQAPVQMLARIFARVRRIHVADIVAAENLAPALIGKGIVPLAAVFHYLKQAGFTGALSIEEASFGGAAGTAEAVAATRRLWMKA